MQMIKYYLSAIIIACTAMSAHAEGGTDISLNGTWSFSIPEGVKELPDSLIQGIRVNVPHTYNIML